MSDINKLWFIFKNSSMNDKDLQKAFERAVTPNACIELLEDIDTMQARIVELEDKNKSLKDWLDNIITASYEPESTKQTLELKARKAIKENSK